MKSTNNIRKEYYLPASKEPADLENRINDAVLYAKKYRVDTAVFRNSYGFHFLREYKYCEPVMDVKFVALEKLCRGAKNANRNTRKNEEPEVG